MRYKLLAPSIALPLIVGAVSSIFTISSIPTWYLTLNKPFFSPPNFIFAPVWTILYILMGVSLYLVLIEKLGRVKGLAVKIFAIQLVLNFLWSFIFFGLRNPLLAFFEISLLWISIFLTIKYFYKISKNSAYLLIPYILWVSFAAVLNLSIVLLNQ